MQHSKRRTLSRLSHASLEALEQRRLLSVGNTIATATPLVVSHASKTSVTASIGDEPSGTMDVDMFKVTLNAGDPLIADVDANVLDDLSHLSDLDGLLRVFDSTGTPVASADDSADPDTGVFSSDPALEFTAPVSGDYYIGVSGYPNGGYDANTGANAQPGFATGDYVLQVSLNNLPVADSFSIDAHVGVTQHVNVLSHVSDADGDPIKLVGATILNNGGGSATVNDNGTPANFADDYISYTPGHLDFNFAEAIVYSVSDSRSTVNGFITVTLSGSELEPDPLAAGKTALFVGGTNSNDVISLTSKKVGKQTGVAVTFNGQNYGTFVPTGHIYIACEMGDDKATVDASIKLPAALYGNSGNDILKGGGGDDILVGDFGGGGPDADQLFGNGGRDLLIGGGDADQLDGGADDDILIGGISTAASIDTAVDISTEWTRTDQNYNIRVLHLLMGNGLNFNTLNSDNNFDDGAVDRLTGGGGKDMFFSEGNGPVRDIIKDGNKDEYIFDTH